jgi:hypothetical protein
MDLSMYLARIVGTSLRVYPLIEARLPRSWRFMSYQRGASAIAGTKTAAISHAMKEFGKACPGTARLGKGFMTMSNYGGTK